VQRALGQDTHGADQSLQRVHVTLGAGQQGVLKNSTRQYIVVTHAVQ
jgi:hypothetical protein